MSRRLFTPKRWTPPAAPADEGRTAITRDLVIAHQIETGGHGPEDVIFDERGRVLAGLEGGRIVALDLGSGAVTTLGTTGGRPLGLQPCPDGSVLICDHDRGLLRMTPDGEVEVLVDRARTLLPSMWSRVPTAHLVHPRQWDSTHRGNLRFNGPPPPPPPPPPLPPPAPRSLLGVLPPDELRHRRHRVGDHAVVR